MRFGSTGGTSQKRSSSCTGGAVRQESGGNGGSGVAVRTASVGVAMGSPLNGGVHVQQVSGTLGSLSVHQDCQARVQTQWLAWDAH
jgi:hypothetical protein